jgi:hypothetical protein
VTERGRVTAATAMEAAMKVSDGDEGNDEGDSGGGQAAVTRVEGKGRWRGRQEQRWRRRREWRVTKRSRASKGATNHFILNWNKMMDILT